MGRSRSTAGGRPEVVCVRFSLEEAADMDARRGSLSRSDWLRFLQLRAAKDDIDLSGEPRITR